MPLTYTSLRKLRRNTPAVDQAQIEATTEAEIARQIADDPDTAPEFESLTSPVRSALPEISPSRIVAIRTRMKLRRSSLQSLFGCR